MGIPPCVRAGLGWRRVNIVGMDYRPIKGIIGVDYIPLLLALPTCRLLSGEMPHPSARRCRASSKSRLLPVAGEAQHDDEGVL